MQLQVHRLTKRFGGVVANDSISLNVNKGEIVGLIGPNGSGKTTLFNSIVGQQRPDSGEVLLEGLNITGLRVAKTARLGLLRTFQQTRTFAGMTCLENLMISVSESDMRPARLIRLFPPKAVQRALDLLEWIGLSAMRDTLAANLSFGQQRLLEIAMGVMSKPKILLLDEPTAGINPGMTNILVHHLKSVSREHGVTLLIIEHNMRVMTDLADRIYCLNRGRVLAAGNPEQIRQNPAVIEAYLAG